MAAFATVSDFATFLQRDLSAPDTATAEMLLDSATQAIKDEVGQTIEVVTETVTIYGDGRELLLLPQIPVTAVTTVTVGGVAWVNNTNFIWERNGILAALIDTQGLLGAWTWRKAVVVNYTHGYTPIPKSLQSLCLSLAARSMASPMSVSSESIGNYSVTYAGDTSGMTLTQWEKRMLDRYRA